ncbi:DUF6777 domain-containing protein [Mycolicibacterium sp. ELW1]|uniref:DUF6777 domain-containing protein n=1 Tax=Mycobacteriaceae TaxID=1762 RepID=UPI0011EE03B7|nr:DUF6777 domain-containing protein [Mycobacterium sp. ELW1]QEN11965.1 hypothetical protein D3H54_00705 [Mycobacterium sp. ELW1]
MNPAPHGWSDPNAAPAASPRTNTTLAVAAVVLTAIVLVTLVAVVLTERDTILDDPGTDRVTATLIAANSSGVESFMTATAMPAVSVSPAAVQAIQTATADLAVSPDRGVRLVSGAHAGLYGAAADNVPCDGPALANFLDAHSGRARAWAEVEGIRPEQIPFYLNTLTPVVLTVDTWVTSHGYGTDGAPTRQQAVLQAGTAVMIDPAGVPRIRCVGAHPLTPPADSDFARLASVGTAWPGYDPKNVVAVSYTKGPSSFSDPAPTAPLGSFTLTDLASGEPKSRSVGGTIDLSSMGSAIALPDPITANRAGPSHP